MANWTKRSEISKLNISNVIPSLLGLLSALLGLLVLLAGTNNTLSSFYFFEVRVTDLNVASKLSGSAYLRELTSVSGINLVGDDASVASLALANSYTVNLLGFCAHYPSDTVCSSANLNFRFNPGSVLQLDSTTLSESYSTSYLQAVSQFHRFTQFVGALCILGIILSVLASILALAGTKHRRTVTAAVSLSTVTTVIRLAVSTAWTVSAHRLVDAINADFKSSGVTAHMGGGGIPAMWIAFALSLISTVMLAFGLKSSVAVTKSEWVVLRHSGGHQQAGKADSNVVVTGRDAYDGAGRGHQGPISPIEAAGKLLSRVSTWGQHKYVQVEKQMAVGKERKFEHEMSRRDHWRDNSETRGRPEIVAMKSVGTGSRGSRIIEPYESYRNSVRQ